MPARPTERRLRALSTSVDVDPREAASAAWSYIAHAADQALAVPGLDAEDVADLREIRQAAAEVAGIPSAQLVNVNIDRKDSRDDTGTVAP